MEVQTREWGSYIFMCVLGHEVKCVSFSIHTLRHYLYSQKKKVGLRQDKGPSEASKQEA